MNHKVMRWVSVILFCSALWGVSEAFLGNVLYSHNMPFASVPLTIVALGILFASRQWIRTPGAATLIAALAMLYKYFNEPFFACHMLGILLTGVGFDVCFSLLRIRSNTIKVASATYAGHIAFALLITYVFRYASWPEGGIAKVLHYIFISGTFAAMGSIAIVRVIEWFAGRKPVNLPRLPFAPALAGVVMWLFGIGIFIQGIT